MVQGERAWHNITKNEVTRIPRRHIFLDTEARIERTENGHVQTWRLGCAEFVKIGQNGKTSCRAETYSTPESFWDSVADFCKHDGRTILWTHNLGYDVRTSGAFRILPDQGWRLVAHNITSRNTWLEWRRERATLVMVDSVAIWNTTLAKVGVWFGLGKVQLALYDSTDDEWRDRCARDVEILRTSILAYLQWLKDADMGNWQITGAGQSWATYRHKFMTFKLTVHDDVEALHAERRAMWAGRCEAYWKGEINAQTVHEWDFSNAYATIARDYPVPVRLLGPMPKDYDWHGLLRSKASTFLARVRVKTALPVVPTERDGRILWPTGEFTTTLWAPEIAALLDAGGSVEVEQGWIYRTRPALREWGDWILSELARPEDEVPVWQKAILKHHSRALIGRMAMTYKEWEPFGESPDSCVRASKFCDMETDEEYDMIQVGHSVWIDNGRVEWSQSLPMITGFIQSIARVKLWDVMQALPERVLLYVDTDSLIATQQHLGTIDGIARGDRGTGLRLKRSWDGFAIYGPRQIVTGQQIRMSGVPRSAHHVDRGRYDGEVWDSLATSLRGGSADKVVIRNRSWHVRGVDHRRSGEAPGWTEAIRVSREEADSNA